MIDHGSPGSHYGSPITGHLPFDGEPAIAVRHLGLAPYAETWHAMQDFTARRAADTPDEIWLVEHSPIYTYGLAGREEHLPRVDRGIPLLKVDRGGQVTYHGPGQDIVYVLIDLRRRHWSVRALVRGLEQSVIDLLAEYAITGTRDDSAPGVYVDGAKIAALGLRIRRGCSYHGLSLNVDMDLAPFAAIDPCGYPDLAVTQLRDLGVGAPRETIRQRLLAHMLAHLRTDWMPLNPVDE